MSQAYLGHYVRLPVLRKVTEKLSYTCTRQCGCTGLTAEMKFCISCGGPVRATPYQLEVEHRPEPWEVPGPEFIDLMWSPRTCASQPADHVLWMPNKRGHGVNLDGERNEVLLNDFDVAADLVAFNARFGKFLEAAEAHFGVRPQVHLGVVFYSF